MKARWMFIGVAATLIAYGAASAADQPIPAKIGIVKSLKLAKFVAKNPSGFPLPSGPSEDPTITGAQIAFFDTGAAGGSFLHNLPAAGWKGLGNPAGSQGFKYSGKLAGDSTCKVVLIKAKVIKGVCKGAVSLTTPFAGNDGILLGMPTATAAAALRYCAELGGVTKKNDTKLLKRKDAPAPAMCPAFPPAVTPTGTATGTPAGTSAATFTPTLAATATRTTGVVPPTPTATPLSSCPLAAGKYTVTQSSGGVLKVYSFAPFPFPSGGQIVEDVGVADVNCVHNVVVPFPNGFNAPNFCVPALGFTTSVTQTGCGIGKIDSNGGSDFDTDEIGDTSTSAAPCPGQGAHPGCLTGADAKIRVDITVGNGSADTCSGGSANALVSIPVHTKSWSDNSGGTFNGCPGDGTFNAGDTTQAEFDQILDFTTASASGHWQDLDGNGCSIAGLGPAGGHTGNSLCTGPGQPAACCTGANAGTCPTAPTGTCMNIGAGTVNTVAQGQFGSTTAGVGDGSFATYLPNTVSGPAAPLGATCALPPVINFSGTATRCLP